jgi:hypothetical protein
MTSERQYRWIIPCIFLINCVVYYFSTIPLLDDSDVPWHLATGRWLLEHHRVPLSDPWSFASGGQPWYLLSWIWNVILGITEHFSGALGVLLLTLMISAAIPAAIAGHLLRIGVALPAIFFTVMIASLCIMDFITARPHLSGYVMVLVFYLILHRSREKTGHLLWILPVLMLIWANMHGSFIAGFSVLGAFILEAFAVKNYRWLKSLIAVSLVCGLTALINPYGLDVIIGAMKTMDGAAKKYTLEWLPFSFSASTGISAWLIVFILASNLRGSKAPIADKILAIGWLIGTLFVMRNGPIFIILSAPYLAICLDEATQGWRQTRAPSAFVNVMQRQPLSRVWVATIAIVALLSVAAYKLPHEDKILSADMSVSDAIDYAAKHYPTHRFLTDFNFGGQVIYRTYGTLPMFMDSRAATVYGDDAMESYLDFLWQKDGWEDRLKKYDVNAIMVSKNSMFAKSPHSNWQLVFAGTRANLYIAHPN